MKSKYKVTAALTALCVLLSGCAAGENSELTGEGNSTSASVSSDDLSESSSQNPAESVWSSVISGISGDDASSDTPASSPDNGGNSSESGGNSGNSGNSGDNSGGNSSTSGGNSGGITGNSGGNSKPTGGGLTSTGNATEGTASTGKFNYGEALQKSILFYELQRSGDIDEKTARTNWRGDSGMKDGADVGLDLTGGLYDAGDNVKFNLPMAYSATMLAWSVYEDKDAYTKSGQLQYALGNIKWICDYLMKCHPSPDVYYYQVGDGSADHAWWGPAEVMQMNRPAYKVDKNNPGSAVSGEAAAALAACAAVYKDIDKSYADKCLKHAKELYNFAESTKSDAGYTAANGFYNSWSGWSDELAWAAVWLYQATNDSAWLAKAKSWESACTDKNTKWTLCWDNKYLGAVTILANLTGESSYKNTIEQSLDWWVNGAQACSPKGLRCLDGWGNLRYATTAAFLALAYIDGGKCPAAKKDTYTKFAESQIDYALGSSGRSYVVGFGTNPPEHPHHRTAQASWADNMNEPNYHRHTLYGALVGGPNSSDGYSDIVSDYTANEVACDYNAGFTGALAKMYKKYGGKTLKNFGAVEQAGEELYTEYKINASGDGFTEIKAMIYNKSAWPARVTENLELRYFVDLSETDPASVTVNMNYNDGAKFGGVYEWNKAKNIYYISIDFSGVKIYPGGQSQYKKEVQFRMSAPGWNPNNDPSFKELSGTNGSELIRAVSTGLYEGSVLVFGKEPDGKAVNTKPITGGNSSGSSSSGNGNNNQSSASGQQPQNPTGEGGGIRVSLSQQQTSGSANTIPLSIEIRNNTGAAINLSGFEIDYFFTHDGNNDLAFWCDHAALTGSGYTALTSNVSGNFSSVSGKDADTKCAIKFSGGSLQNGDSITIQGRITRKDWSNFNLSNDFSSGNAERLYIINGGKPIFGTKP